MDYVLFMQKEVTLQPNVNEVKDCWYASQTQIKELLQKSSKDPNTLVTPWFKLIADHFLFKWWASLNDLSHFENDREIHRMPGIPTQVGTVKFQEKKKTFTGTLHQSVFAGNAKRCSNHFYMATNSSALFI